MAQNGDTNDVFYQLQEKTAAKELGLVASARYKSEHLARQYKKT